MRIKEIPPDIMDCMISEAKSLFEKSYQFVIAEYFSGTTVAYCRLFVSTEMSSERKESIISAFKALGRERGEVTCYILSMSKIRVLETLQEALDEEIELEEIS